jgi:hypothetical protein
MGVPSPTVLSVILWILFGSRDELTRHLVDVGNSQMARLIPILLVSLVTSLASGVEVETTAQRDARMAWWREARFGMFVHWGLYSGMAGTWEGKPVGTSGGMEWIQQRVKADTDTYAAAALPLFKPQPGFAKEWARLAKEAGCRYIVFTTKHH